MTKILSPGELAVGQHITILEHDATPDRGGDPFGGLFGGSLVATSSRPSWGLGEVFTVTAVELPYVVVSSKSLYTDSVSSRSLDTRTMRLMELSPEYIAALERKP